LSLRIVQAEFDALYGKWSSKEQARGSTIIKNTRAKGAGPPSRVRGSRSAASKNTGNGMSNWLGVVAVFWPRRPDS
jgi:hypothetical protein